LELSRCSRSFILTEVSDCGLWIVVTSSTFLKRKDMLKEKRAVRSSKTAAQHIFRQMYCLHLHGLHIYCAIVDLNSSGSPGVRPTPGLTISAKVVYVYVRAYTSTHSPTTLTPAKIQKYIRQNSYLYPCQNIASPPVTHANHAEKIPNFQSPTTHECRCWKNTCDTHACSRGIGQYKKTKCAYSSAYVHPNARAHKRTCICTRVQIHVYASIYTDAHSCIYIHIHMRIYTHICTQMYTHMYTHIYTQTENLRKDTSTRQTIL